MKKFLFTIEVLFALSTLPIFLGMAMSREPHVTNDVKKENAQQMLQGSRDVHISYTVAALRNS
jgi:hypothetical protein